MFPYLLQMLQCFAFTGTDIMFHVSKVKCRTCCPLVLISSFKYTLTDLVAVHTVAMLQGEDLGKRDAH